MPPRLDPKPLPRIAPVKLRPEWAEYLDSLPEKARTGCPRRPWTAEEDALLLAAVGRDSWDNIADKIGVSRNTAKRRYRELQAKK